MKKTHKQLVLSIEDEEGFEEWPLPAIVPVVFAEYKHKIEAECYFGVYDILRAFLLEYEKKLFTKEALLTLNDRLRPYFETQGYERLGGTLRFYRSFVLWNKKALRTDLIQKDSLFLTRENRHIVKTNQTDFDLDELLSLGLPVCATVKDGALVALATVNQHSHGQRLLEATVYTLPAYRGKGYGKSNVALLCRLLLSQKKGIVYCCSCRNSASISLAKAVGFSQESRFYAVDAYRIEEGQP